MRKKVLILTLLFGTLTLLLLMGCAGKEEIPQQPQSAAQPNHSSMHTLQSTSQVPDWVKNHPPDGDEFLYVVESAVSKDKGRARRKATENARAALALKIEANVQVLVKNFEEEVGEGEETEVNALFSQVSKSVANQTLIGSGNLKTYDEKEGINYRVYVLMELPRSNVNAAAIDVIQNEKALYDRWRAAQSFQQLEEEMEKLKERKQQELRELKQQHSDDSLKP